MPPGRKPGFKPFKQNGTGNFRVYVPGRGVVNLETTDEGIAHQKAHQFAMQHSGGAPAMQTPVTAAPNPAEMIESWRQSPPSFGAPVIPQQLGFQSSPVSPSPAPSFLAPVSPNLPTSIQPTASDVATKVDNVLPQDKRKKLADLIARVVVRVNVVACAASVRLLGRIPATNEDEEAEELLKEGWSLQLDDVFVEHPPAPWMVIAAGSVAVGIGMYTDGTPIPKKTIEPPQVVKVDDEPDTNPRSSTS